MRLKKWAFVFLIIISQTISAETSPYQALIQTCANNCCANYQQAAADWGVTVKKNTPCVKSNCVKWCTTSVNQMRN